MTTKNEKQVRRPIIGAGPLSVGYTRPGYTLRWEIVGSPDYNRAIELGFQHARRPQGDEPLPGTLNAGFMSDFYVVHASKIDSSEKLILMEIPNELWADVEEYQRNKVKEQNQSVNKELNPTLGSLEITRK